jgi:TatD DNase family protein
MIDTHCHLYDPCFKEDFDELILRAQENGVEKILLPNIDHASWEPLMNLIQTSSLPCYPMLGLHPCYVTEHYEKELSLLRKELERRNEVPVAIGEIGLDLYWDKSRLSDQIIALKQQLDWALEFDLPVALHVRDAFDPLFEVLALYQNTELKGVFHCFTGDVQQINHILQHHPSFYFGIGGVITYKKSGLAEVVKRIPVNRMLLETDAPYLPPTPHRGKRNEPSFLIHIADHISTTLEIPFEQVKQFTTENAQRLFNLNSLTS